MNCILHLRRPFFNLPELSLVEAIRDTETRTPTSSKETWIIYA